MKKKSKEELKKERLYFAVVMLLIVSVLSLFIFGGFYMMDSFASRTPSTPSNPFSEETMTKDLKDGKNGGEEVVEEGVTSVLILGKDVVGNLSDVIMVATFNHGTKAIDVLSIPRDTFTYFSDKEKAQLVQAGWSKSSIPSKSKMNAMYAYGSLVGPEFMQQHIEDFLQVEIDYYVILDTAGFRDIVDAIGEVEFDVPQRMYKVDPGQDLYIDLYPGVQMLDGDKAEQLVRFRSYPQGDLTRVQVQQDFMKALLKQMLTKDALLNDPIALFKVIYEYVETDFGLTDATKYVKYINDIKMENVTFETMPIASQDNLYVYPDFESLTEKTNQMFYPNSIVNEMKTSAKEANIQVLNGSRVNGLATEVQTALEEDGYTVKNVGTSDQEIENKTIIRVRKGFDATELEKYFDDPIIRIDNKMANYLDIIIVLGLEETGDKIK